MRNAKKTIMKFYSIIIVLTLFSCKREKITKNHSELIGTWVHYTSSNEKHYISIDKDGSGGMEWYKDGKFVRDTQHRKWFIKNDYLLFGRLSSKKDKESYKITMYPTIATYSFITNCDTVQTGEKYMTLDGNIYR
ncbi:MAG: hypothetical protein JST26_13430 [Bacteroidetes bacterium]|nr:hypothetical protein [Bacteroidota bacterium]